MKWRHGPGVILFSLAVIVAVPHAMAEAPSSQLQILSEARHAVQQRVQSPAKMPPAAEGFSIVDIHSHVLNIHTVPGQALTRSRKEDVAPFWLESLAVLGLPIYNLVIHGEWLDLKYISTNNMVDIVNRLSAAVPLSATPLGLERPADQDPSITPGTECYDKLFALRDQPVCPGFRAWPASGWTATATEVADLAKENAARDMNCHGYQKNIFCPEFAAKVAAEQSQLLESHLTFLMALGEARIAGTAKVVQLCKRKGILPEDEPGSPEEIVQRHRITFRLLALPHKGKQIVFHVKNVRINGVVRIGAEEVEGVQDWDIPVTARKTRSLMRMVEKIAEALMGSNPGETTDPNLGAEYNTLATTDTFYWFLITMGRTEREVWQMRQKNFPQVKLFNTLSLDFPRCLGQPSGPYHPLSPRTKRPKSDPYGVTCDYEKETLPRLLNMADEANQAHAVDPGKPRMVTFVMWNPYLSKKDWKDKEPEALRVVKDAVAHGARGVKFYPPMGYRAWGNGPCHASEVPGKGHSAGFPARPWQPWAVERKAQWDYRYQGWNPEDMDELNGRLFDYCVQNHIPILAHCNHGEMQAAAGYAELAHPEYWEAALNHRDSHGERPWRNLKLCLAHSGGAEFWVWGDSTGNPKGMPPMSLPHGQDARDWGCKVHELCVAFPNVYCDVGCFDEVTTIFDISKKGNSKLGPGARFADNLAELMKEPRFARKLMYGSDWFMPIVERPDVYLNAFRIIFEDPAQLTPATSLMTCQCMNGGGVVPAVQGKSAKHKEAELPDLHRYARGFFHDNALAYLGIGE